jgi:hypothetical protein
MAGLLHAWRGMGTSFNSLAYVVEDGDIIHFREWRLLVIRVAICLPSVLSLLCGGELHETNWCVVLLWQSLSCMGGHEDI